MLPRGDKEMRGNCGVDNLRRINTSLLRNECYVIYLQQLLIIKQDHSKETKHGGESPVCWCFISTDVGLHLLDHVVSRMS